MCVHACMSVFNSFLYYYSWTCLSSTVVINFYILEYYFEFVNLQLECAIAIFDTLSKCLITIACRDSILNAFFRHFKVAKRWQYSGARLMLHCISIYVVKSFNELNETRKCFQKVIQIANFFQRNYSATLGVSYHLLKVCIGRLQHN